METETINQLKGIFEPVAQKIGETSQFGWEVVVRQQFAYGVVGLLVGVIGIILGYIVYKIVKKAIKEGQGNDCSNWIPAGVIVGIFGGITSALMIMFGFIDGILHLINPHYYAIEFFLNLVK